MRPPARSLTFALTLMLPPLLGACGAHGKTGIPEGSEKAWADMDHDERMAHMGEVVMPRMQAVFEGHDAERFSTFGCATCHGGGASDGSFEMPNPGLPQLDAANLYKKHRKESPEMVKLMWKHVEPTMGEALAVTYGFGGAISCESCHVVVNQKE
jgi:hypothetical protein